MRRLAVPAILALATLCTTPARADDKGVALEFFTQGKALMSAGKLEEACAKFAVAAGLTPTVGVRLNLAECYVKLGKTASAWSWFDEALTVAERSGDTAAAGFARARQAELKPRLSYLVVVVATALPGLEVARDGATIPQAAWGMGLPVDPGEHALRASAPGREPWSGTITVTEAGRTSVSVPPLAESVGMSAAPVTAAPAKEVTPIVTGSPPIEVATSARAAEPVAGPSGTQRTIAVVSGGLGVVGLAVGTYFGAEMLSKQHQYEPLQNPTTGRCTTLACQSLGHDAVSAGNSATIGLLVGGALAATGIVLWFTAPKRSAGTEGARAEIVPFGGAQGAGLSLLGEF